MVRIVSVEELKQLIDEVGIESFIEDLAKAIEHEYTRWKLGQHSPRLAAHYPHGVMELMPYADDELFGFKQVNGHPGNPHSGHLTVAAVGNLSRVDTGYPILITEMTQLTALRTAATSGLVSSWLKRKDAALMAQIGCGAQSEFQVLSHHRLCGIQTFQYYDPDPLAMEKFAQNLSKFGLNLIPKESSFACCEGADIITTATAVKSKEEVVRNQDVVPGMHLNAIGGDCPGKTELDKEILPRTKLYVEYLPQTKIEGEIQNNLSAPIYAELWELFTGEKQARESAEEITLFDSVGYAIEDFAALKLVAKLSQERGIGAEQEMIPELDDVKNLFGHLTRPTAGPMGLESILPVEQKIPQPR